MQTTFFRPINLLKVRNLKVSCAELHLFGLIGQVEAVEDADVGLVGVAAFVLVLVGGDVVFAGERDD